MGNTKVRQQTHGSWRGVWMLFGCMLLLLPACTTAQSQSSASTTASEPSSLTVDELPLGLGQGYLLAGLEEKGTDQTGLQQGDLAPNFRLQVDDGRHLSLRDLQGRPVLLNFWTTQCGHCRTGMTQLVDTANHQATSDDTSDQLVVLAVNVQEELQQIRPFAEEMEMTLPIVLDANGALRQQYAVKGTPTSIFIDKEGKIAAVWSGVPSQKFLKKFLTKMNEKKVVGGPTNSSECDLGNG